MMLVSVSERLKEIGLKKAIGATHLSLKKLLLVESVILCGLAGIIGLIIGFIAYELAIYAGTFLIPKLGFEWTFNPYAMGLSLVTILIVGILSGLIPALKAQKLQVIEALRAE